MSTRGLIETVAIDCAQRLAGDPYFIELPVLAEDLGDLENQIDIALGRIGACVVVLSPHEEPEAPNAPGPQSKIIVTVSVIENPLINRNGGSGIPWSRTGDRVKALLHHFAIGTHTLTYEGMFAPDQEKGEVSIDYRFGMLAGLTPIAKVSRPAITGNAAAVQIACATAGAAIYFTTDDSYPREGNAAATLYDAPFAVEPGTTVRAVAYADNLQGSDVPEKIFTA